MSKPIENREATQRKVIAIRPRVGGFPYLAETLAKQGSPGTFTANGEEYVENYPAVEVE